MRSFQVMRYGRRTTLSNNQLNQLFGFTSLSKRRTSISSLTNEQYRDIQMPKKNDKIFVHRRNTTLPTMNLSSRRLNSQRQDTVELEKPQTNVRNFYIFFLILFLILFMSVVYSFIRMIKNRG